MYDETHNDTIEDGVFEEIAERKVISTKDLSEEDLKLIEESEMTEVSVEDAAVFAKEIEADVQKELNTISEPTRSLTQREMINAVNHAVREGKLSKPRKQRMMRELGIFKSSFTKKTTSKPTKMNKRKAARKARRKNR